MDLQLKGRNALVTGGSKGIGRAIAEVLAAEGCNVAICARDQAGVDAAVTSLSSHGTRVFGRSVDVADGEALMGWVSAAADALGGIDCLVANVSGGNSPGEAGWRANFDVDLLGTVRCVEAALEHLERSSNASIVVMSSTAALERFLGVSAYNAMKAALLNYSGALAQELGPKRIRVNAVSPGPIMVEGGAWDGVKKGIPSLYEQIVGQIPLGRMGDAQEVASQVALLASPRSAFTTGGNIVIDGGFTKRIQF